MKDKVVIITGASSGIGKALAEEFAKNGSKLMLGARNLDALTYVADQIRKDNPHVAVCQSDVCLKEDCERLINQTVEQFGTIDVLINNAGISMRAAFEDLDLKVLEQLMQVNFWGMIYCTKYAIPYLLKSQGSVVGISSIAGYRGLPYRTGYSSSKFAMNGFLEALRTEMLDKNVHVLTACPGFTQSNIRLTALNAKGSQQGESPRDEKKMMTAEECAHAIYKATKKRKRRLVLTRQGKLTVFLNKWLPDWMDSMVLNHFKKEEGKS